MDIWSFSSVEQDDFNEEANHSKLAVQVEKEGVVLQVPQSSVFNAERFVWAC